MNILFTSSGGELMFNLIKSLKESKKFKKLNFYGVDNKKITNDYNKFFKFFRVPNGRSKSFIKEVIKIVKKNKIQLIIPCSDEESLNLSKNREIFKKMNCQISVSNYSLLKLLNSKIKTYQVLKANNLPYPFFLECKNITHLNSNIKFFIKKKITEFVIKPSNSRGGRDIFIFSKKIKKINKLNMGRELHLPLKKLKQISFKKLKNFFPVVISERLFKPVFDIDILSKNGKLLTCICRRRVKADLPNEGNIIIYNNELRKIAKDVCQKLNLNGLHDIDCMIDNRGNFKIIEINPRMSGSISSSVVAGSNIFEILFSSMRNKKFRVIEPKNNQIIIPYKSLILKN